MKALKHIYKSSTWGFITPSGKIIAYSRPTLFEDEVSIPELVLNYGFKAVEDYVLVNVKVEQV